MGQGIFCFFLLALSITANTAAKELGPAQLRGKEIYHTGKNSRGEEIDVEIAGGVVLTADQHPCVQCHGIEGKGGLDGGILIPEIVWDRLSSPHGVPTALGGIRPPYTDKTFTAAVRRGIASSGEKLDIMMPHYRLDDTDIKDLLAYLQVIGEEDAPGTDSTTITIGSLLPIGTSGQGRAIAALLQRYFNGINARGGIHDRTIRLIIKDPGVTEESAMEAVRAMTGDNDPVFCFLANAGMGASPKVLNFLQQQRIPVIGPLVFAHGAPATGPVYYLLASLEDEARAAARYLKTHGKLSSLKMALSYGTAQGHREMAKGFIDEAKNIGLAITSEKPWQDNDAAGVTKGMREAAIDLVVFFGTPRQVGQLVTQAEQLNWSPYLMTSTVLSGAKSKKQKDSILITPPLAPSRSNPNYREFSSLLHTEISNKESKDSALSDPANHAMVMAAYAAAKVLTEGLTNMGHKINYDNLFSLLNNFRDFKTGVMPPIQFGPNQRVAARGALIIMALGSTGELSNQWINLDELTSRNESQANYRQYGL